MTRTRASASSPSPKGHPHVDLAHDYSRRTVAWMLFLATSIASVVTVALLVRGTLGSSPYMDEIFHLRQTQIYSLHGNWSHWDPKITTLPGLYVLATGVVRASALVLQPTVNLLQYFAIEPFGLSSQTTSQSTTIAAPSLSDGTAPDLEATDMTSRVREHDKSDGFVYEALYGSEMGVVVLEIIRESAGEVIRGKSPILHYLSSFDVLRLLINPALSIITMFIIHRIWKQVPNPSETTSNYFLKLSVIFTFPLSFFFYFLYYTDTGSLMFVLMTLWALEAGRTRLSAVPALLAVFFRQTNIVWVVFLLINHLLKRVFILGPIENERRGSTTTTGKRDEKHAKTDGSIVSRLTEVATIAVPEVLQYALSNVLALVWEFALHACLVAGFAFFLAWNGGITVGDRSAHVAVVHTPQFFYFLAFVGVFGLFMLALDESGRFFSAQIFFDFFSVHLRSCIVNPLKQGAVSIAILAAMLWAVETQTMAHPYLLADNRHYTFYVWQRTFQRYEWFKYIMVPFYYAIGWVLIRQVLNAMRNVYHKFGAQRTRAFALLWTFALAACTAATIVPSPLLEFRYFIVPFVILSIVLLRQNESTTSLLLQLAFNVIINAATLHIFINRPFEWSSKTEPIARFIW